MWDISTIATIAIIFALAGTVKGLVGFGLPIIAVGLTAVTIGLKEAIALILIPSLATNLWQAGSGPHLAMLAKRLWPYLASATVTIWFSTSLLASGDPALLSGVLGGMMVVYSASTLAGLTPTASPETLRWLGPVLGAINGIVTGLTGVFVIVTAPYIQMMRLERDATIQALGVVFVFSTIVLGGAMSARSLLTADLGLMSLAAVAPTFTGVWLGQKLRRKLSEDIFRRVFLAALASLGAYLLLRSLTTLAIA